MRPALHIVREPEDDLLALFARANERKREEAADRAALNDARRRYAEKHGLRALPSLERIRSVLEGGR